jgi:hypothetical protein
VLEWSWTGRIGRPGHWKSCSTACLDVVYSAPWDRKKMGGWLKMLQFLLSIREVSLFARCREGHSNQFVSGYHGRFWLVKLMLEVEISVLLCHQENFYRCELFRKKVYAVVDKLWYATHFIWGDRNGRLSPTVETPNSDADLRLRKPRNWPISEIRFGKLARIGYSGLIGPNSEEFFLDRCSELTEPNLSRS